MMHRKLAILLLLFLHVTLAHAARIELTGFESGANVECLGSSGTVSFQTGVVYTGTYALQTNPTTTGTGYCPIGIISTTGAQATGGGSGTLYTVFRFRADTLPASGSEELFVAEGQSSSFKMYVRVTSAGKLQAYDSTNTQLGSDGATTLSTATWYKLGVKVGTGASAAYEVQINGASELSGTGNLSTNGHSTRAFGKRTDRNGNSVNFYYDDIVIDDASYPAGNSVVVLHPNANGSTMAWTAGTGASDYTQVDEVVPNTTDYVKSTALNNVALFRFETLPGTVTTPIAAVKTLQRVAEDVSGTSGYVVRIRSGSTNSDSGSSDVGNTAFTTRQRLLETDPSTIAAWTIAGVNAAEAGGQDTSGTRLRLAWVTLMVEAAAVTVAPPAGRARMSVY